MESSGSRSGSGDLRARLRRIPPNSLIYKVLNVFLYCVSPFVVYGVLQVLYYIASTPLLAVLVGTIVLFFAYGPDYRHQPLPSQEASPAILTPAGDHVTDSGDMADLDQSEPSVSLERLQNPSKRSYADSSKVPSLASNDASAEIVEDKSVEVKEVVQLHPPPVVVKLGLAMKSEIKLPKEKKIDETTTEILPETELKNSLRYVPLVYQSSEYNSQDQIESLTSMLDNSGDGENTNNVLTVNSNLELATEAEVNRCEKKAELSPASLDQGLTSASRSASNPGIAAITEAEPRQEPQRPFETVKQAIDDSDTRSPVEYQMRVFQDNETNTPIPDMQSIVNAEIRLVEDIRSDKSSKKAKVKVSELLIPHNGNTNDAETVTEININDDSETPIPTTSLLDSVLQYIPFVNRPSDIPAETQNQSEADPAILDGTNNNADVAEIIETGLDAKIELNEALNFAAYFPTKPKEPPRGTKPEDIAIPFSSLPTGKISSLNPMVVNFNDGIDDTFHLAVDHPELFLISSPSQELD